MFRSLFLIASMLISHSLYANHLDRALAEYIQQFKYAAVPDVQNIDPKKYELGKKLFFDVNLSGNKNVSCATCHNPKQGTGDGLPLPVGAIKGVIVPRNSPALYNLDHPNMKSLFWDGRVSYNKKTEVFNTPSAVLNGDYPERWDITEVLGSALAAQAIFPILSHAEMRGDLNSNEIARAESDETAWALIMNRLMNIPEYKLAFKNAFPDVIDFNIGHLGNVLAEFQRVEFTSNNTPWDRYIRGDKSALSDGQKRGAIVFNTFGRCNVCHSGALLGGQMFANIVSPQTGPGQDSVHNDEGRFSVTKYERHKYMFRTPPLRNIALTAPYFHSGAYRTLEDVVEHYRGGISSIDNYDSSWLDQLSRSLYGKVLFVETNHYKIFKKKETAHPLIKHKKIKISEQQKKDLVDFLKNSLTDPKFVTKP